MLHGTPYLNDRTRCKISGSFPQGKPFMTMDAQRRVYILSQNRILMLTYQETFLGRTAASPLFEGPCNLNTARVLCYHCCKSFVASPL